MAILYLAPSWFFGFDIILEIIFAAITFAVAFYSFKVCRMSGERGPRLFGTAFLIIACSYVARILINLFLLKDINETTAALVIDNVSTLGILSAYASLSLFSFGLLTLAYMSLKIKNPPFYTLLLIIPALGVWMASSKLAFVSLLSFVALVYLDFHFLIEYHTKRNSKTLMVLISFVLLTLASLDFMLSPFNYWHYVATHVLELGAFILILVSLVSVFRRGNGKKKKQT